MSNNSPSKSPESGKNNSELNKRTAQRISEIKNLVYGITSKNISLRKKMVLSKENFNKYYGTTTIDKEIEKNQVGKILERVVIEYFFKYSRCSLSEFTQEGLGIDFILRYLDLKIGVDFSLNAQLAESKINKLLKTSQKIDNNHEIGTNISSKRPDLCASMILQLPPYLQANILNGFAKWREDNFQHHWTQYTESNHEVENYFAAIIKIINTIINENIVRDNLIDTIFEYDLFKAETIYNIDKEIYTINIFNNLGYRAVSFSIILTGKYFQKVSPGIKFTRIYDSKNNQVKDYYRNRDLKRDEYSQNEFNYSSSSGMFVDGDIDHNTRKNIPQDIINKIK